MIILACSNLSLSFGTEVILNRLNFNIRQGEKAGLVGVNGAGKSTLFKVIAGKLRQDSGEVFIAKGVRIGYLEQDSGLDSANTIYTEMLTVFSALTSAEERLKLLEKNIGLERDENRLQAMVKEYDTLLERYSREGGYEYISRIRGVLRGLGFEDEQFGLKVRALSGGQKTRLALAKLLLEDTDLLLLDEPTNHLDIKSIEWLEEFLKSCAKSILVISHDRYFLDAVTAKTIELENRECTTYGGGYSEYARKKAVAREIQRRHFEQQQKEIARMEAFIEQQRRWNRERNIIAAESRRKAIDRIAKLDAPKKLPESIRINFTSSVISGGDVLSIDSLSKDFPGRKLFSNISFNVKRGERIFILGPNGCGKSTLLKILAGRLPQTEGNFEYGHKILPGYYDQELEDLDDSRTVLEEVWGENEDMTHTQIRNILAQFLFTGEDVFKTVGVLSGGEKSRVALAKLMLSGANLLLLDEPTNHLDINSREALEEALQTFDGTIVAVSHDRYFISKLASRIIEMSEGGISDYRGDYQYYLEHRRKPDDANQSDGEHTISASKKEHLESKEERSKRRKLEKLIASCESGISSTEARLAAIAREMSDESNMSDHTLLLALHSEQLELETRLEKLYADWSDYTAQLEEMASEA